MQYLVLGASAPIAKEILSLVSENNDFLLITRVPRLLDTTKSELMYLGANNVTIFQQDLSQNISPLLDFIKDKRIDFIINCSSLSSGKKDDQTNSRDIVDILNADILNPIRIISEVIRRSPNSKIRIVFISSFLSELKSYNRNLYSSTKIIMEIFLNRVYLNSENTFINIIKISQLIPKKRSGIRKIANSILINMDTAENYNEVWIGFSGKLLYCLFRISPIFYDLVNLIQRKLRKLTQPSSNIP